MSEYLVKRCKVIYNALHSLAKVSSLPLVKVMESATAYGK